MHLLLRSNWPGNIEQLWQVLRRVVQHRRTGTINPGDLPPECWSVSRRLLSPLESMERDAIVQSLLDHRGNKAKGAGSLGISRATIYRKIREYGIITPLAIAAGFDEPAAEPRTAEVIRPCPAPHSSQEPRQQQKRKDCSGYRGGSGLRGGSGAFPYTQSTTRPGSTAKIRQ